MSARTTAIVLPFLVLVVAALALAFTPGPSAEMSAARTGDLKAYKMHVGHLKDSQALPAAR